MLVDLRTRVANKLLEASLHEVDADEEVNAMVAVFTGWLRDLADVQESPAWITALHLAAMEAERDRLT